MPLSASARARGRRLAITSHPAGMTFAMVFTQHLPTLALVSLGASESAIGLQNTFGPAFQLLQLPALRAVARIAKRWILILGQLFAVLGALPLVLFGALAARGGDAGVSWALSAFALVAVGLTISNSVWFPLLRAYVEPERIGRFFGLLRTGWHLSLILYYLAARYWLVNHPGDFGPLFLGGWLCGVLRIALISRLPERSERTGARIRVREALALVRDQRPLRLYLIGITWSAALRFCVTPFAIVMMRREVGFSESDVVVTMIASFGGGLASLYLWGRLVDRFGPAPIFRATAIGLAGLYLMLWAVREPTGGTLMILIAFFFLQAVLISGFGVADTHVLFGITPPHAPARTLVVAQVIVSVAAGLAPWLVGFALEHWLHQADDPLHVYRMFFAAAAVLQALAFLPLRGFRRGHGSGENASVAS
ncbi:MAG: MFS transporter [Myxococcota bacterium]